MKRSLTSILRGGFSLLAATAIVIAMVSTGKVWADPSASLSKSGSAEVGKTIAVNVKISGDGPYGGYDGSFSYDSSYLEFQGLSAGNYGTANFSKGKSSFLDYNCNIPSGSTIVVLEFKCLKEGSSTVSVNLEVSSLDGLYSYSTGASANINITAPVVLSGNNYLSELSVAPGTLSPSFNKDTQNYHVTVSESTTSIAVTATAEHSAAKVSLNGVQKDLARGDNTVKVTVTAENGDKRTYKIYVTRGTPTPTPEPYPVISCNESSYTILEKGSLENVPSGFTWSETTYNSKKIPCLVGPDGTLLLWLLSDSGNGLYVYDLNKQTVSPCYTYTNEVVSMMIMPFPEGFVVPNGYEKSTYTYNEHEVEVYKNTEHPEQPMLLYLMDSEGKQSMYYLDGETGMILPFRGDISELLATPTPLPTDTPTPSPTPEPTNTVTATPEVTPEPEESGINFYKTLSILLGVFCVGLLAMVVIMAILRNKERNELLGVYGDEEDIDETEDEDIEEEAEEEIEEGDHYYQFGDEEAPAPRRPGAKRAGEDVPKQAVKEVMEEKKEEPLPDFPEFPEKKPEPVIEPEIPTPVINVIEDRIDKSKDASDEDSEEDGDKEGEGDDGEI
ncbi:MAG: cadherin-like beta sandwich domain-containing protein [Clostridiales bacterium]|nr:cadherin-like beta sandwich domain-containing protein [Clostridiales bacterium]